MIISVENLRKQVDCGNATDEQITVKLEAIEAVIRAYTNNNFQQRGIRCVGTAEGQTLSINNDLYDAFNVNDTVQVSGSVANDGVYTIVYIDRTWFDRIGTRTYIQVDKPLMTEEYNLITKVKYPADVIQCAIDMFKWKQNMGEKVGIKSETISRHSVTYEDSATLYMGYPLGILNGLNLYKKARC